MNIQQELTKLDTLREQLLAQAAQGDSIEALEKAQPKFEYGSKEHEALLSLGYKMDKKKAETIVKERKVNPASWPYEMLEKAEAFLEALASKPIVISTRLPWRVRQHARMTTTR